MPLESRMPDTMGELNTANHLLDDPAALDAAWERDGYWFFRNVLDLDAVERLRRVYLDELGTHGVADPADPKAFYNGASLEKFPFRMDPLSQRKVWKPFVKEPAIDGFFRALLRDEPFWIPTVEYRATPPIADRARARFDYLHQDGFYNKGIPFRICWIPLSTIDAEVGGLALAEGLHRGPILHDKSNPPLYPIPDGSIPADRWRRTTYQPGDLLMMDLNTPHSGIANHSDRFRLSMDIRLMRRGEDTPIVGTLKQVDVDGICIEGEDGRAGRYRVDEQTFRRGLDGREVPMALFTERFKAGDEVMVGTTPDGHATIIRPTH